MRLWRVNILSGGWMRLQFVESFGSESACSATPSCRSSLHQVNKEWKKLSTKPTQTHKNSTQYKPEISNEYKWSEPSASQHQGLNRGEPWNDWGKEDALSIIDDKRIITNKIPTFFSVTFHISIRLFSSSIRRGKVLGIVVNLSTCVPDIRVILVLPCTVHSQSE